MSRHINNGRMPNSVPKQAKNVKFDPRDPRDPGVSLNLADGRRQVSELQESADFIRENPQVRISIKYSYCTCNKAERC